jgi:protein TonB
MVGRKEANRKEKNWLLRGLILVSAAIHVGLFFYFSGLFTAKHWNRLEITLQSTLAKASHRATAKFCDRQYLAQPLNRVPRNACSQTKAPNITPLKVDHIPHDNPSPAEVPPKAIAEYLNNATWSLQEDRSSGADKASDYLALVRSRIERGKQYPRAARVKSIEGAVVVGFVITSNGAVRSAKVVKSSGSAILDQAGLKAIYQASPFPRPPVNEFGSEVPIELPIIFEFT